MGNGGVKSLLSYVRSDYLLRGFLAGAFTAAAFAVALAFTAAVVIAIVAAALSGSFFGLGLGNGLGAAAVAVGVEFAGSALQEHGQQHKEHYHADNNGAHAPKIMRNPCEKLTHKSIILYLSVKPGIIPGK
jgi:hypothetical protein